MQPCSWAHLVELQAALVALTKEQQVSRESWRLQHPRGDLSLTVVPLPRSPWWSSDPSVGYLSGCGGFQNWTEQAALAMQIASYCCYCLLSSGHFNEMVWEPTATDPTSATPFFPLNYKALLMTLTRKQWLEGNVAGFHIVQGYCGAAWWNLNKYVDFLFSQYSTLNIYLSSNDSETALCIREHTP